jgi:iron uptake system EfeUOB component EfeO/EfeM
MATGDLSAAKAAYQKARPHYEEVSPINHPGGREACEISLNARLIARLCKICALT